MRVTMLQSHVKASQMCFKTLAKSQKSVISTFNAKFAPAGSFMNAAPQSILRRTLTIMSSAETDAAEAPPASAADVTKLDIRVGKIISVEPHPDADSLYVEQIDVGEPEGPRTIVSGLRKYVEISDLQDRSVLILANLKPRNMRGIQSNGMLLCASNEEHTIVEPLTVPQGAAVGERVYFGENADQPEAAKPNQLQKKKFWEACQPLLKTTGDRIATFDGATMMTSAGSVSAATLSNASIS